MARISLHDSFMDIVMKMSEGNPGALTVIMEIVGNTKEIDKLNWAGAYGPILGLDTLGIYGSNIWVLYKDHCNQNIVHLIAVLRGWQLGFLNDSEVREGNFDPKEILQEVVERLGTENFVVPVKS